MKKYITLFKVVSATVLTIHVAVLPTLILLIVLLKVPETHWWNMSLTAGTVLWFLLQLVFWILCCLFWDNSTEFGSKMCNVLTIGTGHLLYILILGFIFLQVAVWIR